MSQTVSALGVVPPQEMPPALSCDSQVHIYGDPVRHPIRHPKFRDKPQHSNEKATLSECTKLHQALGIERCVFVQGSAYLYDHSFLLDVLENGPKDRFRAVGLVSDDVTDKALERMHEAGFRAVRFNFAHFLAMRPTEQEFLSTIDRIRDYGWAVKIMAKGTELLEIESMIRKVKDVPMVIDHMGLMDGSLGMAQPTNRLILDLLRHSDNWWVMLSDGNELFPTVSGWDEAVEFGQAMYEAAPDRSIWGSDWPHHGWLHHDTPVPTGAFLDLLYRYLPNKAARHQVLVDNPARLFGF